jgi:C4-dicarboxylate-specific signal transduction histidine kinase
MPGFNRVLWSRPSWILRYGVAALAIASTMVLSRWMTPHFAFPGTLYLCAVMLSVWFGGVGPGLLASVLSTLAYYTYFLHSPDPTLKEMPRLFVVFLSNILIALLSAALRHTRDDLKCSVQDLQKTNEALHVESLERKQIEEAFRQAMADLARVNRVSSLGELTASLAHEVNQPIAAAITDARTCLRWLARDQPDMDEARAAASRSINDATRAAEIINRVRLLFKKQAELRELLDFNEVIHEMVLLLYAEAARFAVTIRADLPTDLPQIMGDRVQLQQVLMNLMMNGIDAMKDVDGKRVLTIKPQRGTNGQVLISVSDTGVGLPPQLTEKIFDAFFTTKEDGTGLGLRISRSIVEAHGGQLWASDNSPRGAILQFTLPCDSKSV